MIVTDSVFAYAGTLTVPPVGGVLSSVIATEERVVVAPAPLVALEDPRVLDVEAVVSVYVSEFVPAELVQPLGALAKLEVLIPDCGSLAVIVNEPVPPCLNQTVVPLV